MAVVNSIFTSSLICQSRRHSLDEATLRTKQSSRLSVELETKLNQLDNFGIKRLKLKDLKKRRRRQNLELRYLQKLRKKTCKSEKSSAIKLQALIRGVLARKNQEQVMNIQEIHNKLKSRITNLIEEALSISYNCFLNIGGAIHVAATVIQKHYKGYKQREAWASLRAKAEERLRKHRNLSELTIKVCKKKIASEILKRAKSIHAANLRNEQLKALRRKIAARTIYKSLALYIQAQKEKEEELAIQAALIKAKQGRKHSQKLKTIKNRKLSIIAFRRQSIDNLQPVIFARPLSAHWSHTAASLARFLENDRGSGGNSKSKLYNY